MLPGHSPAASELPLHLQRALETYHAHDSVTLAACYTPDAAVHFAGHEARGRTEIESLWKAWFTAFPDVESDILRAPATDGTVAMEWEERGTHLGRLQAAGFDLRPSGRRLRWRGVSIYELGPDGIESVTYRIDRLELMLQLMTLRSVPGSIPEGIRLLRAARHGATANH